MNDQMQLLLKASESLSELYSHDFYPPPPPMSTSVPAFSTLNCQHASHKWEKRLYQLLFSRELERSEWEQERTKLQKENDKLQKQLQDTRESLVRLEQDVHRVQSSFLLMNGSMNQGYDKLTSTCLSLEEKINKIKNKSVRASCSDNQLLVEKLRKLKSWSELLLKDE